MIVVPFYSPVLAICAAHFILEPIGWKIGSAISSVVFAGITGDFRVIFRAIFGFVYAPLVITGLHHMTNAIALQLIADYHGTMLRSMIALSNIAQGAAVLAMIYLQRKNAAPQEVNVSARISCYPGVMEPVIFGVSTSTTANATGIGGIPGILSIQPQYMPTFALAMLVAIVVPFVYTAHNRRQEKSIDKQAVADQAEADAQAAEAAAMIVGTLLDSVHAKIEHKLYNKIDNQT